MRLAGSAGRRAVRARRGRLAAANGEHDRIGQALGDSTHQGVQTTAYAQAPVPFRFGGV